MFELENRTRPLCTLLLCIAHYREPRGYLQNVSRVFYDRGETYLLNSSNACHGASLVAFPPPVLSVPSAWHFQEKISQGELLSKLEEATGDCHYYPSWIVSACVTMYDLRVYTVGALMPVVCIGEFLPPKSDRCAGDGVDRPVGDETLFLGDSTSFFSFNRKLSIRGPFWQRDQSHKCLKSLGRMND